MKHQYFGDITDYKKYSILRFLSNEDRNSMYVAWALTPDDKSNDGRHTTYLSKPEQWRSFEPDIFDSFSKHISNGKRSLQIVEEENYIPNAIFNSEILTDDVEDRELYIKNILENSNTNILFIDPDNGMEVSSVLYGKKGSSKYVYWHELKQLYDTNSSVLVYQHFARVNRETYIKLQIRKIKDITGSSRVVYFQTSWTVFFLILQDTQMHLVDNLNLFKEKWGSEIIIGIL